MNTPQTEIAPKQSSADRPFAVETFDLTRRFGEVTAVDQLNLHIRQGIIYGLLGPNGAGKSTAIKMLTTLLDPTAGTARVAGHDIVQQPAAVRRSIGYVPQLVSADGGLTGYENLLLSARLYAIPRSAREKRIEDALAFMGLADAAHRLVKTFSGGMIRRLEVAQAMLHRPAVLFLDEPTVGLDPVARQTVRERLLELRRDFGMTVLISTHAMDEADELCDEIAILHLGKVAAVGSPTELKAAVAPDATLEDVFVHFAGTTIQQEGDYRDIRRTRSTARRLG
jgi:ABC-2 type transport system ATP-binding protein